VKKPQAGHVIALSAILVQGPRLVLALLAADRQPVAPSVERILLVVTGIGTAVVLTGGNLYLAHTVATVRHWRRLLVLVWIVVLAASGTLTVPMIAAGLTGRTLPAVLSSNSAAWCWAGLAAVAHELTAAGCILAGAAGAAREASTGQAASAAKPAAASAEPAIASAGAASAEAAATSEQGAAGRHDSAPEPTPARVPCRAGCGRSFRSRLAEAGHLRHCPIRQPKERAFRGVLK